MFSGFAFSFDFYLFISYNYPQSLGSFLLEVAAEALPDEAEELGVVEHAALPLGTAKLLAYRHKALKEFFRELPHHQIFNKGWQKMHPVVYVEGELEISYSLTERPIANYKVFVAELYEVFINRSLDTQTLLKLWLVVDRSCVEEDVLLRFQSEISLAFKVRLSLGNNWEIKYDVSYLRVASAVLNQRRLLAIG